jgi:hypothetical protein
MADRMTEACWSYENFFGPNLKLFEPLFVGCDPLLHIEKRPFQSHDVLPHRLRRQLPIEFRKGSFECHEKHSTIVKNKNLDLFSIISIVADLCFMMYFQQVAK